MQWVLLALVLGVSVSGCTTNVEIGLPTAETTTTQAGEATTTTTQAGGDTTTTTTTSTTTTTVALSTAILIKPLDDAVLVSSTPTFDWSDVTNATKYEIQIDNNSDFSSVTQIATPTASTVTATALDSANYYWRVKAGSASNWGDWGITRRLVVGSVLAKMNGDNYSDVLVGADLVDVIATPGADRGQAYIYFGGDPMNTPADVTVSGGANAGHLGYTVASAGDVNNDGFADALIGAWEAPAGGTTRGQAYLYYGATNLSGSKATTEADLTLSGGADNDYFSNSIASAGDVNNDGYMDIIVGAYLADAGGTDRGRAYIYFGGASMDNTADVTISGTEDNGYLGYSVSSAGDVNNDGYADVIVGAYAVDAGGTDRGQAYIYFGGAAMDNTADVTITGVLNTDQLGWSVASAGDVNGDGYGDVIIGAHREMGGQAYLYFGGGSFSGAKTSADANLTLSGGAADSFGDAVALAGDVNNDGFSDVIVGAHLADASGTDRGQAYVYLGGASMDNTADVTFSGGANTDYFGYSVSTAGDTNNDGYSDVIVGAYLANGGGTDRGQAYIYLGGATMDNTADVTFSGAATSDYLGHSVGGGK